MKEDYLDLWGTAFMFGCFSVLGTVWVYWYLPETKGVALENMDAVFRAYKYPCKKVSKVHTQAL